MKRKLVITLKAWPLITLITVALCFLTQQVAKLFGIELPDQMNIDIVRRVAGWNFPFAFLVAQIIILIPALEELVFRLLLFRLPCRRRNSSTWASARFTSVAAVVTAVLFSAAHYIWQPFPDTAFIALFFFGLAQCWLYRRTQSLLCAILNHGLFNLVNLILIFLVPEG